MNFIFRCSILVIVFVAFSFVVKAQPYVDIVNLNYSECKTKLSNASQWPVDVRDYNLGFFYPKVFKNGNTFLVRLNSEMLLSYTDSAQYNLYSFAMPVGFLFISKNKKWKTLVMGIPRISSDLKDDLKKDVQYGGTGLMTYVINDSCKIKFGLYYNREAFGNFFVPLAGIDWKVSKHIFIYGILPNNLRVEYNYDNRIFTGIGYRNYQRSYRLWKGYSDDYVRVRESQVKFFVEGFLWKNILLSAEMGYTLNYDLKQFHSDNSNEYAPLPVYLPMKNNVMLTAALAYRIRQ
jgi:hypothetical protein